MDLNQCVFICQLANKKNLTILIQKKIIKKLNQVVKFGRK
jgi:hypothetical protein